MLKIVATLVLLLCVTAVVSAQSKTGTERWLNGTWEGTGYQIDNNDTWTMKLTVRGRRHKIEYPSLKCGGRWIPLSIDNESKTRFRRRYRGGHSRRQDSRTSRRQPAAPLHRHLGRGG